MAPKKSMPWAWTDAKPASFSCCTTFKLRCAYQMHSCQLKKEMTRSSTGLSGLLTNNNILVTERRKRYWNAWYASDLESLSRSGFRAWVDDC